MQNSPKSMVEKPNYLLAFHTVFIHHLWALKVWEDVFREGCFYPIDMLDFEYREGSVWHPEFHLLRAHGPQNNSHLGYLMCWYYKSDSRS